VNGNLFFALALGIGFVAGLRSLLAPAVVAWAAHVGWLDLHTTLFGFIGSKGAVIVLSLLALGELIADKMPGVPKRTGAFPLLARIVTGGLCGACLSVSARQSLSIGAILGAMGAVIGAFAGYEARKRLVRQLKVPDIFIALPEDLLAIGLALFFVSR
jgi:uncharacterized membrane protein